MKELKVKVCGMRDHGNIEAVLHAEPDYLGFIFYPKSSRYVGDQPDLAIFDCVPPSTQKVGVFVNEDQEKLVGLCKALGLGVSQLHGQESPEYCTSIKQSGLQVFKAFSLDERFDFDVLNDYVPVVDFFLFDTKGKLPGGTGLKFNWDILKNYQLNVPFLLSGGIGPNDTDSILEINHPQLFAIDINSGFELKPALKDEKKVSEFITAIRLGKSDIKC